MGILYVVATPIGNLHDLTARAQAILSNVALIVAEDTRHTRILLNHFAISTPVQALHEHNESQFAPQLIQRLQQDSGDIALVSDAGTPLISDPGSYLLRLAHQAEIKVSPIPGASALIAALSVSGLRADNFNFIGFLPAKTQARQQALQELANSHSTLIFYEAPHRITATLQDMLHIFGEQRIAVLAKELTKIHENIKYAPLASLLAWLMADKARQKGEFVILVQGLDNKSRPQIDAESQRILNILLQELPLNTAAKLTSHITGISKNQLYAQALLPTPQAKNF